MRVNWDMQRGPGRWICALLVLVAAIHAALPAGEPLQLQSGSAFSASTGDVAVNCAGRSEIERQALPGKAKPPLPQCALPQAVAEVALPAQPVAGERRARAPPAASTTFAPLNPRAPPAA